MRLPTHIPGYDHKHFWPWIAERIAWLEEEAWKQREREGTPV